MDVLTLLQPSGAASTANSGSTKSSGTTNGAGGFEQLLLGLVAPGLVAPQGTAQMLTAAGHSAVATKTSAVGLLAGTAGAQVTTGLVEAGGKALTGAGVLGLNGVLPSARSDGIVLPATGHEKLPASANGTTIPAITPITGVKTPTVQGVVAGATGVVAGATGIVAAATGKVAAQAVSAASSISAKTGKVTGTLTSAAKGQTSAGSQNNQGAATTAIGSAVTAALKDKTAAPVEAAKKPASLVTGSGEVVNAKTTIKSAVIEAPGAGTKSAKSASKNAGSGAKSAKSGGSARTVQQALNTPTVAQAAQAAIAAQSAKSNAASREPQSGKAQAAEPFGAAPTSAIAAVGEGASFFTVSSITSSTGAEPAATTAAARSATPSVPVPQQVAVQFSQALTQGADRITIQLQPESLGRVEVEVELTKEGRLSAVFIAERPETLDMLQRDSRLLERALNEAGVQTDADGLSFSLRGEGRQEQRSGNSHNGPSGRGEIDGIEGEDVLTPRGPILNANALLDIQV